MTMSLGRTPGTFSFSVDQDQNPSSPERSDPNVKTAPSFRDLGFLLLLLVMTPMPVCAQYAFLDLTGDSMNTAADVLSGSLPVNVDVYLVTDRNRNGSPAACGSGAEPLTVDSFEFILR